MYPLYSATIYFASRYTTDNERTMDIVFKEHGGFQGAKDAAYRWWQNRNQNLPDVFHRLHAIRIYAFGTHEIDGLGYLQPSIGLDYVEWKADHMPIKMWLDKIDR